MMKPIIAVDLDGALMYSRPFDEAHKKWFCLMSVLLKDDSVNEYAKLENYFDKVDEIIPASLVNALGNNFQNEINDLNLNFGRSGT